MSLLDSCFSQASRSRSRVRRAGLARSAMRKVLRDARHVPRTRSPARAQLVVRNATQPLNSLVSDTCHCCHCCCCCLRIMTSCCCCVCCSDAGSSECQARPACTEHDYVEYMKPCEDNQVRPDSLKHHILLCFRTLFTMFCLNHSDAHRVQVEFGSNMSSGSARFRSTSGTFRTH